MSTVLAPDAAPGVDPPRERAALAAAVLFITCAAQFMLILDDTIVNVALPTLGDDLAFSASGLSWVVNAYFLTFGGFLLIGGRVADRVGHRRMLQVGLVGFAGASAVCGLAWSPEVLVGARAVQGVAAALLSPAALAVLLRAHPEGEARTRALAVWASLIGAGAATGLLLGGAIVEAVDWRWIFLINLPVAAVALVAVPKVVAADRGERETAPNVVGALLGTAALLLLVFTVVETEEAGWTSARSLGSFAGVLALGLAFGASERRSSSPMVPAELLRRPIAMRANLLVLLAAGGLLSMFFTQTLFMQRVLDFSALETGAAFLPFSLSMGVSSVLGQRLLGQVSPRPLIATGLLVAAGGSCLMSSLGADSSYAGHLMPALATMGLGLGPTFVAVMAMATGGAQEGEGGLASALVTTAQQIGGSIGIAVAVTVAGDESEGAVRAGLDPARGMVEGLTAAFTMQAGLLTASAVLAALLLGRRSVER